MAGIVIRPLEPGDDLDLLTALLHRAYARLAARGLRYVASHQPVATTRKRIGNGECWVAVGPDGLVGTIIVARPGTSRSKGIGTAADWFTRPGVAKFSQFAVDPKLQGQGLGRRLLETALDRARAWGAAELACDTSEDAHELIARYERWGFRVVGTLDLRPEVNYRSVVLSRPVQPAGSEPATGPGGLPERRVEISDPP